MYKYELHAHTSECDLFARLSGAELVRTYQEAGYDGMVITDHYFADFFEWFADELRPMTHEEQMHRYLKGYYAARAEGERIGFTVLPGAEARLSDSINDYLLLGLEEEVFFRTPRLNEAESLTALIGMLPPETCVVHAHPFRDNMTVRDPSNLFGIEVYNAGTKPFRNELARTFAEYYGVAMTSGSDVHGIERAAKGGIETDRIIRTPRDLSAVLRSGEYRLIESK